MFLLITGLRVFENTILRRIVGSKGQKVTGVWKRMHNEELHNSYCSPNIITYSVALQTLKVLSRLRYGRFLKLFRRLI
jgi:hypothetical protein